MPAAQPVKTSIYPRRVPHNANFRVHVSTWKYRERSFGDISQTHASMQLFVWDYTIQTVPHKSRRHAN